MTLLIPVIMVFCFINNGINIITIFFSDEEHDEEFICLWLHCKVTCPNFHNFRQHLLYHGFFENIKAVGNMILENVELPNCTVEFQYTFPIFPTKYSCEWGFCRCEFDNYQSFISHIKCHTNATPKSVKSKDDLIQCMWIGCTSCYQTQLRLREHVRVHTKEKMVACPSCGNTFASRTKFIDHRKRQLSADRMVLNYRKMGLLDFIIINKVKFSSNPALRYSNYSKT